MFRRFAGLALIGSLTGLALAEAAGTAGADSAGPPDIDAKTEARCRGLRNEAERPRCVHLPIRGCSAAHDTRVWRGRESQGNIIHTTSVSPSESVFTLTECALGAHRAL